MRVKNNSGRVKHSRCFIIGMAAFMSMFLCASCDTGEEFIPNTDNSKVNIYAPGYSNNDGAFYWLNGVKKPLENFPESKNLKAHSIAVIGDTILVIGEWEEKTTYTKHYCYWINGDAVDLDYYEVNFWESAQIAVYNDAFYVLCNSQNYDPCYLKITTDNKTERFDLNPKGHTWPTVESIAVYNGEVYAAGNCVDSISEKIFCYWKEDGYPIPLETLAEMSNIGLSGGLTVTEGAEEGAPNIYVAGRYILKSNSKACYWKNGVFHDVHPATQSYTETTNITVVKDIVYISGYYGSSLKKACYWEGNSFIDLNHKKFFDSDTVGIKVFEDSVYVAGRFKILEGKDMIEKFCYWKNGKLNGINSKVQMSEKIGNYCWVTIE